ncbi:hypothetical protein M569_13908, partial [Genlisea aurea]
GQQLQRIPASDNQQNLVQLKNPNGDWGCVFGFKAVTEHSDLRVTGPVTRSQYRLRNNLVSETQSPASEMEEIKDIISRLSDRIDKIQETVKNDLRNELVAMEQRLSAEVHTRISEFEGASTSTKHNNRNASNYERKNNTTGEAENKGGRKNIKLEIPRYTGNFDPHSWLKKCECVFEYHEVQEEDKLRIATCELRFGPRQRHAAIEKLSRLDMGSDIEEFNQRFEELSLNAEDLTPQHEMSMYLQGLPAELSSMVKLQNPKSTTDAMSIANVIYEGNPRRYAAKREKNELITWKRMEGSSSERKDPPTGKGTVIRRLPQKDFEERKAKGLCFHCDEKFMPGHKCKRLFVIEFEDAEEEEHT